MIQFDEHIFQMGWNNHQPVNDELGNHWIFVRGGLETIVKVPFGGSGGEDFFATILPTWMN